MDYGMLRQNIEEALRTALPDCTELRINQAAQAVMDELDVLPLDEVLDDGDNE